MCGVLALSDLLRSGLTSECGTAHVDVSKMVPIHYLSAYRVHRDTVAPHKLYGQCPANCQLIHLVRCFMFFFAACKCSFSLGIREVSHFMERRQGKSGQIPKNRQKSRRSDGILQELSTKTV